MSGVNQSPNQVASQAVRDLMARLQASTGQTAVGGNPPPAPPPQQAKIRPRARPPAPVVGGGIPPGPPPSPAVPPSGGNGSGDGRMFSNPAIRALVFVLLAIVLYGGSTPFVSWIRKTNLEADIEREKLETIRDEREERKATRQKEVQAPISPISQSQVQSVRETVSADELQLPRNSSITLTGPTRKVIINSVHRIQSWNGEFMLSMENAQTNSWTSGFSSHSPAMSMETLLARLREIHSEGHTAHRFWIEIKSGQTVQLNVH